jgi:hypothetical protein
MRKQRGSGKFTSGIMAAGKLASKAAHRAVGSTKEAAASTATKVGTAVDDFKAAKDSSFSGSDLFAGTEEERIKVKQKYDNISPEENEKLKELEAANTSAVESTKTAELNLANSRATAPPSGQISNTLEHRKTLERATQSEREAKKELEEYKTMLSKKDSPKLRNKKRSDSLKRMSSKAVKGAKGAVKGAKALGEIAKAAGDDLLSVSDLENLNVFTVEEVEDVIKKLKGKRKKEILKAFKAYDSLRESPEILAQIESFEDDDKSLDDLLEYLSSVEEKSVKDFAESAINASGISADDTAAANTLIAAEKKLKRMKVLEPVKQKGKALKGSFETKKAALKRNFDEESDKKRLEELTEEISKWSKGFISKIDTLVSELEGLHVKYSDSPEYEEMTKSVKEVVEKMDESIGQEIFTQYIERLQEIGARAE